jgi:hypothetical protein
MGHGEYLNVRNTFLVEMFMLCHVVFSMLVFSVTIIKWAPGTVPVPVPVPGTRYQVPGTRYQVPGTRYQVPGTRYR